MIKKDHLRAAVFLLLRKGDKLLLLKRSNTGFEDGKYSLVAGHVEIDEGPIAAIIREAHEEVGIRIQAEHLQFKHVLHRNAGDARVYVDYFFECHNWVGEPTNQEPDKCSELTWYPLSALPHNTITFIRTVLGRIYQQQIPFSEIGYNGEEQ
jgi:8-oxo-dGTP diphosphatase